MNASSSSLRDEGEEIGRWLGVLVQGWAILIAGALAGGVLAFLATLRTPPVFEAVATLNLTPPRDRTSLFTPLALRTIYLNPAIASDVVKEVGLNAPPFSLSPGRFLSRAVTVEDVPNTYLTRVRVRLPDPEKAAAAARRLSERAVEHTARIWQDSLAARITDLEPQVARARDALAEAEGAWLNARRSAGATGPVRRARSSRGEEQSEGRDDDRGLEQRVAGTRAAAAAQIELLRLEDDAEVRRDIYLELTGHLEMARIEHAATTKPLRLIDPPAVPDHPLPTTRNRTIALGVVAGLIIGAAIVLAWEWRTSRT